VLTAFFVVCALPSVFTYVAYFSVYAAAGSTTSALAAPLSPWWPCDIVRSTMESVSRSVGRSAGLPATK
jgi:hypothetical protein